MALAAVQARGKAPLSLAEELVLAERAVTGPRTQVIDLQARYDSAVSGSRHQEAADMQPELTAAREKLLIAEAKVTALRHAQDVLSREDAERAAEAEQAQRREQAQIAVAEAIDAERQATAGIAAKLDLMWTCVAAARGAFTEAQELELEAGRARRRAMQARMSCGDIESMPAHISAPNTASVLAERDPLIRELLRWTR